MVFRLMTLTTGIGKAADICLSNASRVRSRQLPAGVKHKLALNFYYQNTDVEAAFVLQTSSAIKILECRGAIFFRVIESNFPSRDIR